MEATWGELWLNLAIEHNIPSIVGEKVGYVLWYQYTNFLHQHVLVEAIYWNAPK